MNFRQPQLVWGRNITDNVFHFFGWENISHAVFELRDIIKEDDEKNWILFKDAVEKCGNVRFAESTWSLECPVEMILEKWFISTPWTTPPSTAWLPPPPSTPPPRRKEGQMFLFHHHHHQRHDHPKSHLLKTMIRRSAWVPAKTGMSRGSENMGSFGIKSLYFNFNSAESG